MVTNLYGVYVGGSRKDGAPEIEVRAENRKAAIAKTREWLGDAAGAVKLRTRLKIYGYSFHAETPSTTHPLYQSAARH